VLSDQQYDDLIETRARRPEAVAEAARSRKPRDQMDTGRGLLLIAADHAARGVVGTEENPTALASRRDLLGRLVVAMDHQAVDGIIATADVIEELLLLRALDDKIVIGSMNRSGLAGSAWEMDDRFNCYDPPGLLDSRLDGGKMLLRIDMKDPASNATIVACGENVTRLARSQLISLVEPLPSVRLGGRSQPTADPEAMARAVSVASGLGATSAYTWLQLPPIGDLERSLGASSLPTLMQGGDPNRNPDLTLRRWEEGLRLPQVRGLIAGRNILYPTGRQMGEILTIAGELVHRV